MLARDRSYWLAMCHPITLCSAVESAMRWLTFGFYKPCLVSIAYGLLEEWKESKDARCD